MDIKEAIDKIKVDIATTLMEVPEENQQEVLQEVGEHILTKLDEFPDDTSADVEATKHPAVDEEESKE